MNASVKKMTKNKIKKFGGGALSAVDSSSVQGPEVDKSFYVEPRMSVNKMGDGIMEPKQTINSKALGVGKGFDFGQLSGKIYKTESSYDNIPQLPKQNTKGFEANLTTPGGNTFFGGASKTNTGGSQYSIGAKMKFGGGKKHGGFSTMGQDEVVMTTGGFADSNYQSYVKKLIEE